MIDVKETLNRNTVVVTYDENNKLVKYCGYNLIGKTKEFVFLYLMQFLLCFLCI